AADSLSGMSTITKASSSPNAKWNDSSVPPSASTALCVAARRAVPPALSKPLTPSGLYFTATRNFGTGPSTLDGWVGERTAGAPRAPPTTGVPRPTGVTRRRSMPSSSTTLRWCCPAAGRLLHERGDVASEVVDRVPVGVLVVSRRVQVAAFAL